ncbi:MAG: hypothetical protein PHU51_05290 [Candidatus Nanoarchaeia archaeon]|nr:hypothetical protein [Candidatus Nanoarchaeia archaeon]
MPNQITISEEYFKILNPELQELLTKISSHKFSFFHRLKFYINHPEETTFEKRTLFYLENHSPEGKVEKDLCGLMNEMVEMGELTPAEKFLIKSRYKLHRPENNHLNFGNTKDIAKLVQEFVPLVEQEIELGVKKIENYNKSKFFQYAINKSGFIDLYNVEYV